MEGINYAEMQEATPEQMAQPQEQPEEAVEQPQDAQQPEETAPEPAATEQPESAEPENGGSPDTEAPVETPAGESHDKMMAEIQNKIFEVTQGKTKDPNDFIQSYTELQQQVNELSGKKPVVNAEVIQAYNEKLKAEKGYDLATALNWSQKDIDSMSEKEKLEISLKVENPDLADRWYKERINRLDDAAQMTQEKLEERIEELGLEGYEAERYRREVTDLQIERENMLKKSQNLLKKHKESYDFNINFEGEAGRPEEQKGPSPEKLAEVKAQLSGAIGKIKSEALELDLPLELGKLNLEIDYTPEEKNAVIDTTDPEWGDRRYGKKDGTFDLDKMMRDRHRMLNYESTMKRVAEKAMAETIKAYEAKRDNIVTDKSRKTSEPSRDVISEQVAQMMQNYHG